MIVKKLQLVGPGMAVCGNQFVPMKKDVLAVQTGYDIID